MFDKLKKLYDWAVKLPVIRSIMKIPVFAKIFSYEVVLYVFFGAATTAVYGVSIFAFNYVLGDKIMFSLTLFNKSIDFTYFYLSTVLAWLSAVIFAFLTNKLFVFESKSWEKKLALREFAGFIAARLFSLGVDLLGTFILFSLIGLGKVSTKLICQIAIVVMNYFFSKFIIFKNKGESQINESSDN